MLARSMARASREGAVIFRLPRSHLLGYGSAGLRASAEEHVWTWLREIEERLEDTLAYDLHSRLARLLARLAAEDAHQMVWETHEELAALLGAHREDVSKAISHIRALDLVRTHQGQRGIKVIDPARLSKC